MKPITDISIVPRQPRWPVRLDPVAPPSLRRVVRDTSPSTTEQTTKPITDMEQSASSKAYHAAVRPLTDDEYALLKEDIAKRGIISPIIKDAAGNIVDGYHRNKIAEELGLTDIPIKQVDGTEAELQAMAIALNVARRRFRGSRHDAMPRMKTKAMYSVAKIKGLVLAGALLSAGVTQAKTVTVMGAGVQTCGTWLEHAAKDYRDYRVTDTQWVIG